MRLRELMTPHVISIDDILKHLAGFTRQLAETVRLGRRIEKRRRGS